MPPLQILILSDGRPGHYHLAEGVAAAIARRVPVTVRRLAVERRREVPGRVLAAALRLGVSPATVLQKGYGIGSDELGAADLVVSAGGDTIAACAAAARLIGAANIFCGTLRHLPAEAFSLVVSSYARHASLPRHLVTLKPSGIDPDTLPRRQPDAVIGPDKPPRLAGLLVGGPSGLFHWREGEWSRLVAFLGSSRRDHGTRWIVSTSPRTPDAVADLLQAATRDPDGSIVELIDFRKAGPGTLPRVFAQAEAILATEDSSTMVSEAVSARLPVVGVAPLRHRFKDEEAEYRALMMREGWIRSIALAELNPATFLAALSSVRPLAGNHLDRLADALVERLPDLLRQTRA